MAANALVTTRIDPQVKEEASAVLEALGLTVSDAMRMLLTKVAQEGVLPFDPLVPSKESVKRIRQRRKPHAPDLSQTRTPSDGPRVVPVIPPTSPERYLSGMAALNLPSESGTGDWHLIETFFKPRQRLSRLFIAGSGCAGNTNALLGDSGVFECSASLDELKIPHPKGPVFAANHARAIADLVLVSVLDGGSPDHVRLDDWMPRDHDKQAVFDLIQTAIEHLTSEQREKVLAWQAKSSH